MTRIDEPLHRGRKVTSLGVLFNFTGNDKNTTVQPVANMVKEAWVRFTPRLMRSNHSRPFYFQFADAIKDEPDFFLLAG